MNATCIKKSMTVIAALILVVSLAGCGTTMRKKLQAYPKPLAGWDKTLIDKYTELIEEGKGGGTNGTSHKLKFIADYHDAIHAINTGAEYIKALKAAQPKISAAAVDTAAAQEALASAESDLAAAKKKYANANKLLTDAVGVEDSDAASAAKKAKAAADIAAAREDMTQAKLDEAAAKHAVKAAEAGVKRAEGKAAAAMGEMKPYDDKKRAKRNEVVAELMLLAQASHEAKDDVLHYGRATGNVLFDGAQLIATGLASTVGSESTARALATLATGTQGFQESVDKRFFYEHATAALLSIMHTQRMEKETILIERRLWRVEEYPLEAALDDFAAYLLAGGLTDALRELSGQAGAKELTKLAALEELKKRSDENLAGLVAAREKKEEEEEKLKGLDREIQLNVRQRILEALNASSAAALTGGQ